MRAATALLALPILAAQPALADAAPPPGRLFLHASFGVNVYTHLGPSGGSPASDVTPDHKLMLFEQAGVGYWVHPLLRVQLTFMFGETVTGLKPGASPLTLVSAIPCLVFTFKGLFVGTGPLFAPLAFGTWDFHVGLFTVAGVAFRLGGGVSLGLAVQAPVMFEQRFSVAVTPAVILGKRF